MRELERSDPHVRVVWRAFELRPDPVPTLDPSGEYLTRVWRDVVYPLSERMGVAMRLPPMQPRTRLAHAATVFAAENGRFHPFQEGVFRAFFERGEDIGSIDVLVGLGKGAGLNSALLRQLLEIRELEAQVSADEERAEQLGVDAVPAYVAGGARVLTGVRTVAELRRLMRG